MILTDGQRGELVAAIVRLEDAGRRAEIALHRLTADTQLYRYYDRIANRTFDAILEMLHPEHTAHAKAVVPIASLAPDQGATD